MHVVSRSPASFLGCDGAVRVHPVPDATDNLVWLVEHVATRRAVVIDGPSAGPALARAERDGLELAGVWNTHTHHDHVGVNQDLDRRGLLSGMEVVGPASRASEIPGITVLVGEGDTVRLGEGATAAVWLTEGHMDGHVSYVMGDLLFCGDTLFAGGCGYLFDGPPAKMFGSLMRLAGLPGDTRVCCAHEYTEDNLRFAWSVEPDNETLAERIRRVWAIRADGGCTLPSTIEEERATNPFLRPGSPTLIASVRAADPSADLSTPERVFAATRRLKDSKAYRARGDEGLPLG